jgi:hypothetical protein
VRGSTPRLSIEWTSGSCSRASPIGWRSYSFTPGDPRPR